MSVLRHLLLLLLLHCFGCDAALKTTSATCTLQPANYHLHNATVVTGNVLFTLSGSIVIVSFNVTGLASGQHSIQINDFGDILGIDGLATGTLLIGSNPSRPTGVNAVGALNNSYPIYSEAGVASGSFTDSQIALNGVNSIIGRSLVVTGSALSSTTIVSQCVIGVLTEDTSSIVAAGPAVSRASCALRETSLAANAIGGFIEFEKVTSGTRITVFGVGLPLGLNSFAIYSKGDVSSTSAASTGSVFAGVGPFADNRIAAGLLFNGTVSIPVLAAAGRAATLQAVDAVLTFSGNNNFVGRSVVVTSPAGIKIAQCVIGIAVPSNSTTPPAPPSLNLQARTFPYSVKQITQATAMISSTSGSSITGYVQFTTLPASSALTGVQIRFVIAGLTPGFHLWSVQDWGQLSNSTNLASNFQFGGIFNGQNAVRPEGSPQAVGLIGDGVLYANQNGIAQGTLIDSQIALNGPNSIVARGINIFGDDTNFTAVAAGVIGRSAESSTVLDADSQPTLEAWCQLGATSLAPSPVQGYIHFRQMVGDEGVVIDYSISGLSVGQHGWHVHVNGNLIDAHVGAAAVTGHFVGTCPFIRPPGILQEVGMLDNGVPLNVSFAGQTITGSTVDNMIRLNGLNSILGRSVVIHAPAGSAVRHAACVIGIAKNGEDRSWSQEELPMVETVPTAGCVLSTTTVSPTHISGDFSFVANPLLTSADPSVIIETGVSVAYSVRGLGQGVHQFHCHVAGDVFAADGQSCQGHFIGASALRDQVGALNNNQPISSDAGVAIGAFTDRPAMLNGVNSILGRTMIVHGDETDPLSRLAQCVIGTTYDPDMEMGTTPYLTEDRPPVREAICTLAPTSSNADQGLVGFVTFAVNADNANIIEVAFVAVGLAPGTHSFSVNSYGDVSTSDASGTLGVFRGASPARAYVGALGNGYTLHTDASGVTRAAFSDAVLRLNGFNSIVGRSLVVYGDGTVGGSNVPVAQCVIGVRSEGVASTSYPALIKLPNTTFAGTVPQVNTASVLFSPTSHNADQLLFGYALLSALPASDELSPGVMVHYLFTGLTPGPHSVFIHTDGDMGVNAANPASAVDGSASGGLFVGACPTRFALASSNSSANAVGVVNNGQAVVADAAGRAHGWFIDTSLALSGFDSVVGRILAVHATNASASSPVVAQGIIGRVRESYANLDTDAPAANKFTCRLLPTQARYGIRAQGGTSPFNALRGAIILTSQPSSLQVTYNFAGLAPGGSYYLQLHSRGDMLGIDDGVSAGPMFPGGTQGTGTGISRPSCQPQLAGLLNGGVALVANASGMVSGSYVDTQLRASGANSPLGRSIVLHGDGFSNPAVRIGWCTVGAAARIDPMISRSSCPSTVTPAPTPAATLGPNGCFEGFIPCDDSICRPAAAGCPLPVFTDASSASNFSTGVWVGVGIAAAAGLLLLCAFVCCAIRRRQLAPTTHKSNCCHTIWLTCCANDVERDDILLATENAEVSDAKLEEKYSVYQSSFALAQLPPDAAAEKAAEEFRSFRASVVLGAADASMSASLAGGMMMATLGASQSASSVPPLPPRPSSMLRGTPDATDAPAVPQKPAQWSNALAAVQPSGLPALSPVAAATSPTAQVPAATALPKLPARRPSSPGKRVQGTTAAAASTAPQPDPEGSVATALPAGWQMLHDDKGTPYYLNTITNQTQWEEPAAAAGPMTGVEVTSDAKAAASEFVATTPQGWELLQDLEMKYYYFHNALNISLPPGWEPLCAASGETYYLDTANNVTQWDLPTGTTQ